LYKGILTMRQAFRSPALKPPDHDGDEENKPCVVLLMDDEESIREAFGTLLKIKGFIVYTARDGDEAIKLYKKALSGKQRVDVAIIDLTIPEGIDGLETIIRIREIDPDVRAILSTGHPHEDLKEEYKKAGFIGILPKPYTWNDLAIAIENATRDRE
jgi:DNA-binding NtrC family response regulator